MLGLLSQLVEIFTNIPLYILFALETLINLFFSSVEALFILSEEVLGGLPEPGAPAFIEEINWFFPIGLVLSIAAPVMSGYVIWLGVKFVYKKIGDV